MVGLLNRRSMYFFCNSKGQHGFETKLAFLASYEARRRMAVFPIQLTTNPHQTREPRGPSPSGGKTPANLLSLEYPRALWGAVWGAGGHPLPKSVARTESWP